MASLRGLVLLVAQVLLDSTTYFIQTYVFFVVCSNCERSVGTVFQLPSLDAIYSQDKEKERKGRPSSHDVCVRARSTCC
jgi:hypothetical protein